MKGENFVIAQMSLLDCFQSDDFHFWKEKTKLILLTESVVILCKFRGHVILLSFSPVPSLICKNQYFCHCGIIMNCMAVKFLQSRENITGLTEP